MATAQVDEAVTAIEAAKPEELSAMLDRIVSRLVGERHKIPNQVRLDVERAMVRVQSRGKRR